MPSLPNLVFCAFLALACFLSLGCQPEQQVEQYTVERTSPPSPPLDAPAVLEQLDHILVAIVPQGEKAWFFKMVGKAPAIKRQRETFNDFLATVQLAKDSADTPSWELPEGWTAKEASQMRAATLVVPDSEGELELAVSSLPFSGDWEDFLVPNVNRWLRQLQRAEISKSLVLGFQQEAPVRDAKATIFELSGVMAQRPMMGGNLGRNPHEGLGIAPPRKSPASQPSTTPPTTTTPSTTTPPVAAPSNSKALTYKTPQGWLPGQMSMMRKAAFLLPGGGPADGVTVTSFPAAPGTQMADVASNVRRWARQVGMAPPEGESLDELTEPITISGGDGTYVELTSPSEAAIQRAIYVAMLERKGLVWFFKMDGKPELASGQRAAFREFLGSVAFREE